MIPQTFVERELGRNDTKTSVGRLLMMPLELQSELLTTEIKLRELA